jgi:hypothetical protein
MGRYRIFLIGNPQPVEVDLPAQSVGDVSEIASRVRFLEGHMAEPAIDGVFPAVLIPTCRIQFIIETN